MSKKDAAKDIGIDTGDRTLYGNNKKIYNQNGTVSKKALIKIAKKFEAEVENKDTKPIIIEKICNKLGMTFEKSKYIGENGQVPKLFLKDVNDAQKK